MFDNGFMPAASVKFKEEMKMDNAAFGFIGSFVYVGQAIGSFIASPIIQRYNPAYILTIFLLINIASLIAFCLTESYWAFLVFRAVTGFCQVFFTIYMPVWADCFGSETQKGGWLALLIVSNPLGAVLGYSLMAVVQSNIGWRWAFYIQSILLFPNIIPLLMMPSKYLDIKNTGKEIVNFRKARALVKKAHENKLHLVKNLDLKLDDQDVGFAPGDNEAQNAGLKVVSPLAGSTSGLSSPNKGDSMKFQSRHGSDNAMDIEEEIQASMADLASKSELEEEECCTMCS